MGIKVVILDLSGTTFNRNGQLQEGIKELLSFCKKNRLKIAFVTNDPLMVPVLKKSKLEYDCLVTPKLAGRRKPSPEFIYYIQKKLDISKDRFIYIGDSDERDAFCAAHAKILYLCAKWANSKSEYGIPINSPIQVKKYIQKYLLKKHYWGWKLERKDSINNRLRALALLNCQSHIKGLAVNTFKWGELKHRSFFLSHLIASIYLSGIYKEVDYWATYPSHNIGGSLNSIMKQYIKIASKEFKDKYEDLFVRHKQSKDSGATRNLGKQMKFENQIGTVHLNPGFRKKLKNKKVLVLDDFITKGFSIECARALLYKAEVLDVVCIGVGKYGNQYTQITIDSNFDPFQPVKFKNIKVDEKRVDGKFDPVVTDQIEASFKLKI